MIGVSLPFGWFSDGTDYGPILQLLKQQGVGSVELRTVRAHHTADSVLQAAKVLWDEGFQITVHGSVTGEATAITELFEPLQLLWSELGQEGLNVTIHPIVGDNAAMLIALSDYILENHLPVTVTLENNRLLPDKTQGDSAALVLEAVEKADRENIGICFDMGHYAYYVKKNCPDTPALLPPEAFWKRVKHTHIHAMNELRTHWPLDGYELQLEEILDKLSFEYFGVYNLELDFPRIAGKWTPAAALSNAIPYLRSKLHYCVKLYDTVREEFDGWFRSALEVFQAPDAGTAFALIHSSSYLFKTNGCRWGMDIAFRNARFLAKTPAMARELLKDLQLLVLSHGHRDHYEESTLKLLGENDTLFLVPDFLEERTLSLGIPREKLVIARPGEKVSLLGMEFLPFVSSHFRPNGKGVQEYGYYVTAPGCPSMAFPVDIRDFTKRADVPKADYCFANVWLKDNSADRESWGPVARPWAEYMLSFSEKNIFLTHLYEDGRPDNRMWRAEHAQAVTEQLQKASPNTHIRIPQRGEIISL